MYTMHRIVGLVCIVVCAAMSAGADVPQLLNYQGYVADSTGVPLDTTVEMTFRIYDDSLKTSVLWNEVHSAVSVESGNISVLLGTTSALEIGLFDGSVRWMTIQIGTGQESDPPLPIVGVAYAIHAEYADTAGFALAGLGGGLWTVSSGVLYSNNHWGLARGGSQNALFGDSAATMVNLGTACTTGVSGITMWHATISGGGENSATSDYAVVGGGKSNKASGARSTVGGGSDNTVNARNAVIGGGHNNSANGVYSTVSGGIRNAAGTDTATVAGGYADTASGNSSTVGGGYMNKASGAQATVSGGGGNVASGLRATVGGGAGNTANGDIATVCGGYFNVATAGHASVGGGYMNIADGEYATIGGGRNDTASGNSSTVSGGYRNTAGGDESTVGGGVGNIASGERSTVGGGAGNFAGGYRTTVGGGYHNATGDAYATISGGCMNVVNGEYSAVAGGYADTIYSTADYSYLFGVGSRMTEDSTFMVDMPHIRFGSEASGYEFPASDGSAGQVMTTDGAGQLSWADGSGEGLTLPYAETVANDMPGFWVTNTSTSQIATGITGMVGTPSGSNVYSAGVSGGCYEQGWGVTGVCLKNIGAGGFGALGSADWGVVGSGRGGVKGMSNASTSYGVYAINTNSNGTGLYAQGGSGAYAAEFRGNVVIKSRIFDEVVVELGEGLDYAEGFDISGENDIKPGAVVVIDPENPGALTLCNTPYDRKVAGVVAGANGLGSGVRLGAGQYDHDVALAGRVYCNVDASFGAIAPGDLLTTSPNPGYAMKVTDYSQAQGAILGKAMEPLEAGKTGQVLVLVTLQ